jgi:hypothetical protein
MRKEIMHMLYLKEKGNRRTRKQENTAYVLLIDRGLLLNFDLKAKGPFI